MRERAEDAAVSALRVRRELALHRRIKGDVYKRSPLHRGRLDRAGLGRKKLKSLDDLAQIAPMELGDIAKTSSLLLAPHPSKGRKYGAIRWIPQGQVPFAYSAVDLKRLGLLGAEVLERAGIGAKDVIFDVGDSRITRDQLQIQLGAQHARIALFAGTPTAAKVRELDVSVITGEARPVIAFLESIVESKIDTRLHTVIVTGEPGGSPRRDQQLNDLLERLHVEQIRVWAPAGVFAAWSQCRGGIGLHLWPKGEVVEVVDATSGLPVPNGIPGDVLWTGAGWNATAVLRLKTSAFGHVDKVRCPACGRAVERFVPHEERTSFVEALDQHPDIDHWAAELHSNAESDELHIWIAPKAGASTMSVLAHIDRHVGEARVNMVDVEEVARIIEAASGEKYGDRRAFASTVGSPETNERD